VGGDGFQWPTRRFDTLTHRHTHLHTDTPARVRMKLNKNARNERHENRSREKDERKSEITRPDSSPLLRETRVVGGGWVVAGWWLPAWVGARKFNQKMKKNFCFSIFNTNGRVRLMGKLTPRAAISHQLPLARPQRHLSPARSSPARTHLPHPRLANLKFIQFLLASSFISNH